MPDGQQVVGVESGAVLIDEAICRATAWSGQARAPSTVPVAVVWRWVELGPIRSISPTACVCPLAGSMSWYFSDDEPALTTMTRCLLIARPPELP
jgi:hypothetical protein